MTQITTMFEDVVPAEVRAEIAAIRREVAALEPKLAELNARAAEAAWQRTHAVAAAGMFDDDETQSWYFDSVDEASGLSALWDECQRAADTLCTWTGARI